MTSTTLVERIERLSNNGTGLLAADESNPTASKRMAEFGVESTTESRRRYRELLISTPGLSQWVSGVILYDETVRQADSDGTPLCRLAVKNGLVPGVKVDRGTRVMGDRPREFLTEGIDALGQRLVEYRDLGAEFTKWRAVFQVDAERPTPEAIKANAHALGKYAAIVQEHEMVPIVEPEVLMEGNHSLAHAEEVTSSVLEAVFQELTDQRVALDGILLKPNMIVPGKQHTPQASISEVAEATVRTLLRTVPAAVPGIGFLSGGQDDQTATAHLNEINRHGPFPWNVTFSFARALTGAALKAWSGKDANRASGQAALAHRARLNAIASQGRYSPKLEKEDLS
ncbi:fructose-bisphosphate aldolase class I [Actinopolyspora biskrensis]|uniref:Probable fructose-bisphosphate aldolase class 1 n=1 Tax=Actinopolyspora biskrensis TaxID=1470178 RepID=A0A852YX61_9ACTN|nr:class I fructose-bisphosphate aldolase [Actinopolyspora biskrensis]NYH77515.1 fructose-bisphosphate aldolase class I [Actinopolyspora biskrensis]